MRAIMEFIGLCVMATLIFLLTVFMALWLLDFSPFNRDDSDRGKRGNGRSGVKVITDDLTGCQYLEFQNGGITPRMDAQGRHLCIPVENKGQ